jgi:hypothetical protein
LAHSVIRLDDIGDRYRPRTSEELASDRTPVTVLNELPSPDNVTTLAPTKRRSLHAVLCEALMNTQAVHARLEAGVTVREAWQREVVRALYVATRNQAKALIATLELQGLE